MFWDDVAPPGFRYWAVQRESHNVALLQLIQASVETSEETNYLKPDPRTKDDAIINLFAFSQEGRKEKPSEALSDRIAISSMPRLRECFGWIKVSGRELHSLPRDLRPSTMRLNRKTREMREILISKEYYAIVYEYIPQDIPPLDNEAVQSGLDFLWLGGFCFGNTRPENWVGGILLDMADFACPWSPGWARAAYRRVEASAETQNVFTGAAAAKQ